MRIPLAVVAVAAAVVALAGTVFAADSFDRDLATLPGGPTCMGARATLIGTPGPDQLKGTARRDVVLARAGADRIRALGGADLVCGGPGADRLLGAAGNDRLKGAGGDDRLDGGAGTDTCDGGAGSNSVVRCETPNVPQTTPVNRAPSAAATTVTTSERSPVDIDLRAAASDPDGDTLLVESIDTAGTTGDVVLTGTGVATFSPAGHFASLAPGASAETSFGFTVSDGKGLTSDARATVTVTGVDDDPVAVGDNSSLGQGDAATVIDVLANDTDVDGGPRSIESVEQAGNGTVAIDAGGSSLSYEPDPGYCNDGEEADKFTYTLAGGSSATVAVTVACVTTISASAPLEPGFDPAIHDYTVKCDGAELEVSGRTATGTTVSVDGAPEAGGEFETTLPLEENQEFEFTVDDGAGPQAYFVRCLPSNFPVWDYEGFKSPSHQFYIVTPDLGAGAKPYGVIFDSNGVPVWWKSESPAAPSDASILADGTIVWWASVAPEGDGYVIQELDGTIVDVVRPVGGIIDPHEFQVAPNGNYFILSDRDQEHVDLTAYGGGPDDTLWHAIVQEVTPEGDLVWEWSTEGNIDPAETGRWWPTALKTTRRDFVHINAIEPVDDDEDGEQDAVLISLRHTDGVYKIDKATGKVVWKLGGTWTPKSLTVLGDPEAAYPLGGQHDVRLLPDGTITIYDNNTNQPFAPRSVRYQVDEVARTATMVEQVTDPLAPFSICCGSSRRSDDGSWLFSWGGRSLVTEFNGAGERTFKLSFDPGNLPPGTLAPFSYRAVAAPDGILTAAALRDGMNSMHPR